MRTVLALLAAIFLAAGPPICHCVHPAGSTCAEFAPTAGEGAPSCCESGSRSPAPNPADGGCCCLGIDSPTDATVAPAGLLAHDFAPSSAAAPFAAIAPPPLTFSLACAPVGALGARPVIRSAPDVPLYRLHASLRI